MKKSQHCIFIHRKDLYDIMEPGSMVIYQQNKLGMTTVTEIDGQAVGTSQEGE